LKRREKSSLEIKFEDLIKKLNLPYKFVGNGEVIIARKCPDFVDLTGKKIAIEVFYRKHKELFRGGLEEWKAERIRLFNQEGWEIIFFDETEVNEKEIKEKLNVKTGGN
jgi:very-short-patch-repair endonuclease